MPVGNGANEQKPPLSSGFSTKSTKKRRGSSHHSAHSRNPPCPPSRPSTPTPRPPPTPSATPSAPPSGEESPRIAQDGLCFQRERGPLSVYGQRQRRRGLKFGRSRGESSKIAKTAEETLELFVAGAWGLTRIGHLEAGKVIFPMFFDISTPFAALTVQQKPCQTDKNYQ
jgi:hypothetical protein